MDYRQVADCRMESRRNPLLWFAVRTPFLIVSALDGSERVFSPVTREPERLVNRINLLREGRLRASRELVR